MNTPEQINEFNRQRVNTIFQGFKPLAPDTDTLSKSEGREEEGKTTEQVVTETVLTLEGINKFKEDLFKGIDEGTVTEDDLNKAQEDLLSLRKETRKIDGKLVEVFIK